MPFTDESPQGKGPSPHDGEETGCRTRIRTPRKESRDQRNDGQAHGLRCSRAAKGTAIWDGGRHPGRRKWGPEGQRPRFGARHAMENWVYKEADFPLYLALRSQQSVYSELLQLRNPRLCTHHSDPIPSLRSSPSGTDTLPSVVGEHGDLWSRDDRHQRLPLNKGTSRSKGNRLATTQSRIDLL